ncbi:hypothetical protein [Paenibacillus agricola]|uniref:Uncharacterized protein n=1 Tax=Paenibacillus agricola TaxID=2716264 RepID=A0ABX0J9S5_9BACL|nr:hypothetical protein [Paenibacillus agricola]NHN33202.1 hypothetical protein [Paenibacillus agricola]
MLVETGVTYWGVNGKREIRRKVNLIETRTSGTQYVNYTNKKMNGLDGSTSWTKRKNFEEWAKGIYAKD